MIQNKPDANVCAACETAKPGAQPTSGATNPPGFNSATSTSFSFRPSTGSAFSFGAGNTSEMPTGFWFGSSDGSNDMWKQGGFTFGADNVIKEKGPSFSFVQSTEGKDSTQGTGVSFGSSNEMKDKTEGTGFSFGANDASKEGSKEPSLDEDDSDTDEETDSDFDSESDASEKFSSNSLEAGVDDSYLKLPTPSETKASEKDLRFMFQQPKDSWECETCLIQNSGDVVKCLACESSKPGTESSSQAVPPFGPNVSSSTGKDGLNIQTNPSNTATFYFGTNEAYNNEVETNGFKFPANEKSSSIQGSSFGAPISNEPYSSSESRGDDATQPSQVPAQDSLTTETSLYPKGPPPESGDLVDDLKQKFQAPKGSWECDVCMVRNPEESGSCVACQAPKPGTEQIKPSLGSSKNTFSFGGSFGGFGAPAAPGAGFKFVDDGNANAGQVQNTNTPNQGFTFGNAPVSQDVKKGGPKFGASSEESSKPVFSFGLGNQDSNKGFSFGSTTSQTSQPGFNFGDKSKNTSGDSESQKTSSVPESKGFDTIYPTKPTDTTNLLSHGSFTFRLDIPQEATLPSSSNKDLNVSEDNPEKEDESVVFKPIVSLPKEVDIKSGEEDETTMFSGRAKLYRFTEGTWKERGVGEIKVLYDPNKKRGRVIMRRDQVHILCANHYISNDMVLKPQGSSDKSWVWHAQGDFADSEGKEQLFAVKFKDAENAVAFKQAFEDCLDNKVSLFDELVSLEDEVIVVYDVSVTEEQRRRAERLMLPHNFYSYESLPERASEEEVKQNELEK